MCNIRWKFLTPQKIPRENGGKSVKIVDVQESYWSVLQSSNDVSHPPISWGFVSFLSLSLFLFFHACLSGRFILPGKSTAPTAIVPFSRKIPSIRSVFLFPTYLNPTHLLKSKESPILYFFRLWPDCLIRWFYLLDKLFDVAIDPRSFVSNQTEVWFFNYSIEFFNFIEFLNSRNIIRNDASALLQCFGEGERMAGQGGSSRKSLSMTSSSLTGKKKAENGGSDLRKSFSVSRSMYVQFCCTYSVSFIVLCSSFIAHCFSL